jgi:GT2 family glycosyltransferase
MTVPLISVVVPTRNRDDIVQGCVDHISSDPVGPKIELLVIDDSTDGSLHLNESTELWTVRVIRSGGRGHATARNAGWRQAVAETIVFLDDDIRPVPGTLECLHTAVANGEVEWASARIEPVNDIVSAYPTPMAPRPTDDSGAVFSFSTQCIATRRRWLEDTGGFDETLRRQVDTDMSFRARQRGHRLRMVSGAAALDHDPKTSLAEQVNRTLTSIAQLPYLYEKYHDIMTHEELLPTAYCFAPFYWWRGGARSWLARAIKHLASLPGIFAVTYYITLLLTKTHLKTATVSGRWLRGVVAYKGFQHGLRSLQAIKRERLRKILIASLSSAATPSTFGTSLGPSN